MNYRERITIASGTRSGKPCIRGTRITVADNGPGISPENRAKAFERFWRGSGERETGAGLGLAIVQEAAHALQGTVHITDGLMGRGCAVVVDLPTAFNP